MRDLHTFYAVEAPKVTSSQASAVSAFRMMGGTGAGIALGCSRAGVSVPPFCRACTRTTSGAWDARQGQGDLLLDVLGNGCRQLPRETIDQRAERSFLRSIGHWRFSDSDNGAVTAQTRARRFYPVAADQASEKRTTSRTGL